MSDAVEDERTDTGMVARVQRTDRQPIRSAAIWQKSAKNPGCRPLSASSWNEPSIKMSLSRSWSPRVSTSIVVSSRPRSRMTRLPLLSRIDERLSDLHRLEAVNRALHVHDVQVFEQPVAVNREPRAGRRVRVHRVTRIVVEEVGRGIAGTALLEHEHAAERRGSFDEETTVFERERIGATVMFPRRAARRPLDRW